MKLSDKQALLQKALEYKTLSDRFADEYETAKAALKRAMETDGSKSISGEDDSRAYFKPRTTRKFKGVRLVSKLPKAALVSILAENKVTQKQLNVLIQTSKGVKVDSLMVVKTTSTFTCELPKDKEKKKYIEDAIASKAEEDMQEIESRVKSVSNLGRKGLRKNARQKRAKKA